ncbi:MAG: ATP synthase F1 subunit delta [Gemmatimonadota bacterium]
MRDETVARSYAETLFDLAERHEGAETYGEGIETVARLLDENPDARLFLETPRIDAAEKKKVLRRVFGDVLPGPLVRFLMVTVDKRRQRLIREMAREYRALMDEHLNRAHVEVTVARPLDDETTERVSARLSELLGKTAIPHVRVKPAILGGIVVRTGDTIYDGSLRRRMEGLRRQLLDTDLPEPEKGLPAGVAPPADPTDVSPAPGDGEAPAGE